MKKLLLVLLVSLGLQTQAQINICDSVTVSGSQYQLTIEVNNINTIMYYWESTGSNGLFTLAEDSMTNQHSVYNVNPVTQMTYDTILTCANTNLTTCCWTFIWDGLSWARMGTQPQISYCDSLSYSIVVDSSNWNTLTVTGNMNGLSLNMIDSMDWNFTACNTSTCYTAQGNNPYSFPLISPQDTVKLCYDAFVYQDSTIIICNQCDSLVYDFMTDTWVLMSMSSPVGIEELMKNEGANYKMYDLLGREVTKVQIGVMYIRNNKKYIRVK